jgi:hypothetical protein
MVELIAAFVYSIHLDPVQFRVRILANAVLEIFAHPATELHALGVSCEANSIVSVKREATAIAAAASPPSRFAHVIFRISICVASYVESHASRP